MPLRNDLTMIREDYDCSDAGRVQRRHGAFLQRDLGLCALDFISLANSREVLCLVNRPGNVVSH